MPYQTVALIGKPQHAATHDSLNILAEYLLAKGCKLLVEESIAEELETKTLAVTLSLLAKRLTLPLWLAVTAACLVQHVCSLALTFTLSV